MKTIRIANGTLDRDLATGRLNSVFGVEKGAQDAAHHLLRAYEPTFQEGNGLINSIISGVNVPLNTAIIKTFLTEAINRLIIKQASSIDGDRIVGVERVFVEVVNMTVAVFAIEVRFISGATAPVVQAVNLRPTQLGHLFDPSQVFKA
jgi:hypothetical protein